MGNRPIIKRIKILQFNNDTVRRIFIIGLSIGFITWGGYLINSHGDLFNTTLYGYSENSANYNFGDFFGNLYFNTQKGILAWELNSDYPYPALANGLYWLVGQLTLHVPHEQIYTSVIGIR